IRVCACWIVRQSGAVYVAVWGVCVELIGLRCSSAICNAALSHKALVAPTAKVAQPFLVALTKEGSVCGSRQSFHFRDLSSRLAISHLTPGASLTSLGLPLFREKFQRNIARTGGHYGWSRSSPASSLPHPHATSLSRHQ